MCAAELTRSPHAWRCGDRVSWGGALLWGAVALAGTAALTGIARSLLRRFAILARPNERSSHQVPVPRGGGVAVVSVVLVLWLVVWLLSDGAAHPRFWFLLVAALMLAVVSWLDDYTGGLTPVPRVLAQAIAVGAGLFALPGESGIFQGLLPHWLDMALAGLAWLWFVNLFNFMDGIDGIAGSETGAIGLGAVLLAAVGALGVAEAALGLVLVGAAVGFLAWNWQPAKIFLGDVGSVPLGYLIGWLLLALACQGLWPAALLLPAYYLADASLTLARRLLRRERIWQAHREHFYQHAVRQGRSHAFVVVLISATNGGLLILALISTIGDVAGYAGLASGAILISGLLWYLRASRNIDPNEA